MSGSVAIQNPRTRPLAAAERDRKIIKLRASGWPLEAIAEAVGASERTVRRVVARRLEELRHEIRLDTGQLLARHVLELEHLRQRLSPLLAATDPLHRLGAVRTFLQLQEREARLLGLDQPMRVEVAAQAQASQELLQHLADKLDPAVMEEVVSALTSP